VQHVPKCPLPKMYIVFQNVLISEYIQNVPKVLSSECVQRVPECLLFRIYRACSGMLSSHKGISREAKEYGYWCNAVFKPLACVPLLQLYF
jgi:hypothetical protein